MRPLERRKTSGFTLIEMLLVVVIIGILAAIVMPNLVSRREEADRGAAKATLASFLTALDAYAVDNGRYPTTDQGLQALVAKPEGDPEPRNWKGPYLRAIEVPLDPWGHPYRYQNPGGRRPPLLDVYSAGADGVDGTADDILAY